MAVLQQPPLKDAAALPYFLCLIFWYSKFIPNHAAFVESLHTLLPNTVPFTWMDAAHTNVERVKDLRASSPALTLFDPTLPTIVTTDASDYGHRAVLPQP